jgi:hypothetical protein
MPGRIILYPNPAFGPIVNLIPPVYPGTSDIEVKFYTLAFRLVMDTTYSSVLSGSILPISLTDKRGYGLANGLYYVVVKAGGIKTVGKLIILK